MRQALIQVRLFLEQHGESRFSLPWTPDIDRPVANRAGFRRPADTGATYYVLPEVWRSEVCKGLDARWVARMMADRGWLSPQAPHLARKDRIPVEGLLRVYVIPPSFLCADVEFGVGTMGTHGGSL